METWVVLVEAAAVAPSEAVDATAVESLLARLGDERSLGLYAPDRYVLQVRKVGERAEQALSDVLSSWRAAAADVGLHACTLVRAEIMTAAELDAEVEGKQTGPRSSDPVSPEALAAVHDATRRLLRAQSPKHATGTVVALVHRLGGFIVLARVDHPYGLPFDLSFGEGAPISPAAVPYTTARRQLEALLPDVLADARQVLRRANLDGDDRAGRVVHRHAEVRIARDRTLEPNPGWRH